MTPATDGEHAVLDNRYDPGLRGSSSTTSPGSTGSLIGTHSATSADPLANVPAWTVASERTVPSEVTRKTAAVAGGPVVAQLVDDQPVAFWPADLSRAWTR